MNHLRVSQDIHVYFLRIRTLILLYNHSTMIKIRKFNMDAIKSLQSIFKLYQLNHKCPLEIVFS